MKNQLENNGSYLGFTDNKTALQKAKIESCLDKVFRYSNGKKRCYALWSEKWQKAGSCR